jgi:hypothetical protein
MNERTFLSELGIFTVKKDGHNADLLESDSQISIGLAVRIIIVGDSQ